MKLHNEERLAIAHWMRCGLDWCERCDRESVIIISLRERGLLPLHPEVRRGKEKIR